ncbi:PIG-L family deacetylase [Saccharothrix algeriensis]|uniref:LmbE family N-acetylglucosaminyl deacetylase n=2 Tax=Saccharothrix algeriensis TaxID=173560 RepID=A0ABS2RZ17_9PSEU|nr:PIG-L family deacetylase [Saccharothrix algeriensis]MBM7809199.1 LmbE family N-acetylglucosaminyl deacetylase [Saccharothrix algeriensis]
MGLFLAVLVACGDPTAPPAAVDEVAYLQIVAHHDDDLLFMNPDVRDAIRSGHRLMTVFLTAGEAEEPDANGYSAARQAGARAAYARMAGVPDEWDGAAMPLADGRAAERYALRARPQVALVFLNLPEDADPRADGGRGALRRLWEDRRGWHSVRTLLPTGGVVATPSRYTGNGLIRVLVGLMAEFRPTVLRTQDADPDPAYPFWRPWHDHPDHVMSARFAEAAGRIHRRGPGRPRLTQVGYRDYNTETAPANLAPAQQDDKIGHFAAYQRHDRLAVGPASYDRWPRRMYYRWDRGTSWAARGPDGRLHAFAVQGAQVLRWRRTGDRWEGAAPDRVDGPLAAGLAVGVGRGGLTVCGRRLDTREITCRDDRGWVSLGSPDPGAARVGTPAVAAHGDGRLAVFVRDATGGVSRAEQDGDGRWGRWDRLGGQDVQDGLSAAPGPDGAPEVFASTTKAVVHWASGGWDGAFPPVPPAGPPVAVPAPGGTTVVVPVADTGEVARVTRSSGSWSTPVRGPGPGGPGGLAAVWAGGRLTVVGRSGDGGVTTDATGSWAGIGGAPLDYPAAVVDDRGRPVALYVGPDGRLHAATGDGRDGAFTPWTAVD